MDFIGDPKKYGIDPIRIAAIQENAVVITANLRTISENLVSVSATFKALADQLSAKIGQLPPVS